MKFIHQMVKFRKSSQFVIYIYYELYLIYNIHILIIKLLFIEMMVSEQIQARLSPSMRKKVRICSLNEKRKDPIAEINSDNNILVTTPQFCPLSPKVINLKKKSVNDKKLDDNTTEETPKLRHRSMKTQGGDKKMESCEQFDKLLEITSRCVDYYNKFVEEKEVQIKIVKQAFIEINDSLNKAFNGIIVEIKSKQNEIKSYLEQKQYQLIKIKQQQQKQLSMNLNNVKQIHLINFVKDCKSLIDDPHTDIESQLCNYANTLHKFYNVMEKVQKYNFKQGVDETINFINNIISQQLKFIIYEKIPNKSLNTSFSFNDGFNNINTIRNNFNYENSLGESLEQSLEKCIKRNNKKQVNQVQTQTFIELCYCGTNSESYGVDTLSEINKKQNIMKNKIDKYEHFQLLF